ncbi:MAG: hypothetical protein ACLTSX_02855 [Collinsella sp.]
MNKQLEEHGTWHRCERRDRRLPSHVRDGCRFRGRSPSEATRLTLLARDLVGAPACEALIRLIRESDAALAHEREEVAAGRGRVSRVRRRRSADAAPAVPAGSASSVPSTSRTVSSHRPMDSPASRAGEEADRQESLRAS